jgi:hypothetical protein
MNTDPKEHQIADRVRRVLDTGTETLDNRTTYRLQEMRQEALRHQAKPVAALSLAGIGHFMSESFHNHYRALAALLALAIGAAAVQIWQDEQHAQELAEIDSALLADEVSPNAYLDQGFLEWLDHLSHDEEDSLPQ